MAEDNTYKQGDSDEKVLAKIVRESGGAPDQGDNKNSLLKKWLETL